MKENMFWDNEYNSQEHIWGKEPSELAIAAVRYLKEGKSEDEIFSILDIGCGYGRDAFYFSNNLKDKIFGIDISEKAINIASKVVGKEQKEDVRFRCCDFKELKEGKFDIVFISNLYQLLRKKEREELRKTVMETLKPEGLLFLSTLSTEDTEHYGKGTPIAEELNSFQDIVYLHFCGREELIEDFALLNIKELYEHEYYEPRVDGKVHHHISWILIGEPVAPSS